MVHPASLQNNCNQLTKPAKPARRLELAFWPTQHGSGTPWVGMRYAGSKGAEVVTPKFADPMDAANELMDLASREGLPLVMPEHLRDSLIARWRIDGAAMYARSIGREWCQNAYMRQGWDAAYLDDCQPMLFRAWPAMAGVGAE